MEILLELAENGAERTKKLKTLNMSVCNPSIAARRFLDDSGKEKNLWKGEINVLFWESTWYTPVWPERFHINKKI